MRNEQFSSALYVLIALAYNRDRKMNSKEIALGLKTNPVVVRRIMAQLSEAGLIRSRKGREGGVWLAHSPEKISLADVYRAVELPEMISKFQKPVLKACVVSCSMKKIVSQVSENLENDIRKSLTKTKLSDLVEKVD
jgi:Rrf2 family protein